MNKFLYLICFFTFVFTRGEFVDGVVAKIGNNTILYSDLLQTIQIQAMQNGIDLSKNKYYVEENHETTLAFLIDQHIVYEIAKRDTLIVVSGDEISATLDNEINMMVQKAGSKKLLEDILEQSIQEYKMSLWVEIE